MVDRADAHNAVPGFEMPPCVPGERRHTVAEPDAVTFEALGHFKGARANLGVVRGVNGTLNRARNYGPGGVVGRRVVDNPMAQQRPVLHQSEHGVSPQSCLPVLAGYLAKRLRFSLAMPAQLATHPT